MPRLAPLSHKAEAHQDGAWAACWAGDALLTGSVDESVAAWSVGVGGLEDPHIYSGHSLGVVALAADGTLAASSALDSCVRVWDIATSSTKAVLQLPPAELWGIAFAPGAGGAAPSGGARVLAVASGAVGGVTLYDVEKPQDDAQLAQLAPPEVAGGKDAAGRFALSVAFSPDGRRVACGAMDGAVHVFDVGSGKHIHKLDGHALPVRSLAYLPDSQTLLTACDDKHVHLYDAENAELLDAVSGHGSWVLSVSPSPDGTSFVTGSSDRSVKLWSVAQRTCEQTLTQHTDAVWGVAFRADGARVASVSDDHSVAVYDYA